MSNVKVRHSRHNFICQFIRCYIGGIENINSYNYGRRCLVVLRSRSGDGNDVHADFRKALLGIVLQFSFVMTKLSHYVMYLPVVDEVLRCFRGYGCFLFFFVTSGKTEQRAYASKDENSGYDYSEMLFHSFPPILLPLSAAYFIAMLYFCVGIFENRRSAPAQLSLTPI